MKGLYLVSLAPLAVSAWPTAWPTALIRRGKAGIFQGIFKWIEATTDTNVDAWDTKELPDFCAVTFSTYAGGECKLTVTCNDGEKKYDNFNVCEIGKQQYWNDDRIGEFSIEYSEAGGINSEKDGLHGPVLRIQGINNWEPLVLKDVAKNIQDEWTTAKAQKEGPRVCYYNYNQWSGEDGKFLRWGCGIPKLGRGGFKLENDLPDGQGGYAPGQCGIHIVQLQKPNPAVDPYSLEVKINDANQDSIAYIYPGVPVVDNRLSVPSKLPLTVELKTGAVDADDIEVSYGGDTWRTGSDRCSQGAYEEGHRKIDCGFHCD